MKNPKALSQEEYIRQVLDAYRMTPGTMGTVRRADRLLAAQFYQRGLSVKVIENAFVLAATRRLIRGADAPPLGTIRSLAYFLPVIEGVLECVSARITSNISATRPHGSAHRVKPPRPPAAPEDDGNQPARGGADDIATSPGLPTPIRRMMVESGVVSSSVPGVGHLRQALRVTFTERRSLRRRFARASACRPGSRSR